jgi:hypothetical protein
MLKTITKFASSCLILGFVITSGMSNSAANELELVVGTGGTSSAAFSAGNGMSIASVIHGKGIKIYNYGTKGDKDNIKRLTKKKRAINLAIVSAKGLAKANDKQKKGMSGLIALGKAEGDTILLIVRNQAPKGVSKDKYSLAISEVLRVLKDSKAGKVIKNEWRDWSVSSGESAFKAAGVKRHKAAL